jgi:hypothetical protein
MEKRTQVTFPQRPDFWPTFERWAGSHGYSPRQSAPQAKLYQKGKGFLVAPMMLSIQEQNGQVAMEAWVRCNLFVRLSSFFILPAEIGVQSGGVKAVLPRKIGRDAVNALLQQLGVPLIP